MTSPATHGSRSSLFGDLDVDVTIDAPLGARTWYGIGGTADVLVQPRSVDALETLMRRCHRSGVPVRVLGSGANLLVADDGIDGIVVRLDHPTFRDVRYNDDGAPERMRAFAGADLSRTVMDTARRGLAGLDVLAGIPASIGGALRMNAGGAFGAIGDTVDRVVCVTRTGERVTYPASELRFDYRTSNIPDPVIVAAVFRLEPTDPIALRDRVKEIFAYKKSTQPLAESSAGCAFRNPIDPVSEERVSAGRLIDETGLKGLAVGGASVSERHANFVVVEPGTRSRDVIGLLDTIRERVFDRTGIELEREIVVWERTTNDSTMTGATTA